MKIDEENGYHYVSIEPTPFLGNKPKNRLYLTYHNPSQRVFISTSESLREQYRIPWIIPVHLLTNESFTLNYIIQHHLREVIPSDPEITTSSLNFH